MTGEQWRAWAVDAGERIGSTAAQAGVAEAVVLAGDLPQWAAAPLIVGLTSLKVWLARYRGERSSASLADRRAE